MAGKPRQDRTSIAARHIGMRLTPYEGKLLDGLVDAANRKLKAQGVPPVVTQVAIVRLLIEQEAARQGIVFELEEKPKPTAPPGFMNRDGSVTPEAGQTSVTSSKPVGVKVKTKVKQGQG